jgi:hypothetical protein
MPIFLVEKKWVEEQAERQSGTEMGYSLQSDLVLKAKTTLHHE